MASADTGAVGAPEPVSEDGANNRVVIPLLLVSAFVVILNETIMTVALPRLMADLGITAAVGQWLTTAFMLTMAVVIPITGFLLQRFSTRSVFLFAMTAFSIGTLICALSPSIAPLIAGRVVQAIGTAVMMPLLMTTVMTLVPEDNRGQVMGNISIVISVAPAIGPTISGLVLNYFGWRWLFIFVLPLALIGLTLGWAKVRNISTPRKVPLDIVSIPLTAIGFGGLVYGLSGLGEGAHGDPVLPVIPTIIVAVVVLGIFIWRQLRLAPQGRALLDLSTFKIFNFSVALTMMALAMGTLFGTIILLPIYMQSVLGMEPLGSGLLLLPGGLVMGLMAPFVGRLYDRIGARKLVIPGTIIVSLSLWLLTTLSATTPVWELLAIHVILSVGLALLFTPLFTAGLGSLPAPLYSHGSAAIGAIQQVAGAAAVALFISMMSIFSAAAMGDGVPANVAMAAGTRAGFTCGAILSLVLILASFFVRRPENAIKMPAGGGH